MPSKSKTIKKSDKPKRKANIAQIAFGIFAALLIITMLLSLISRF